MSSDLVASRPGGFDIIPAHGEEPTLVYRFGDDPEAAALWLSEGLSNAWMLSTPEGRLIINTGMGFEGPVHRRCFDRVDQGPVKAIAFTQGHVDHVGGTDAFLDNDTDPPDVIAGTANASCQDDDERIHRFRVLRSMVFWAEAVAKANAFLRGRPADPEAKPPTQATPRPNVLVGQTEDLTLGGVRIEFLPVPGGETLDSLMVWFPDHRVAIVGNLFSALFGHVPNLNTVRGDRPRDVMRFVESAELVLDLEPEILCTGHFSPIVGAEVIRAEVTRIRDAMKWLNDTVVFGMNRGDTIDELMEQTRLPSSLSLGEGYGTVRWAVRSIWQGYAGWFEFRSTTELHGVPRSSVDADLVALAGPDALVDVARTHLEMGRPLHALHLLEPVRATQPHHQGAIRAEIAAHEDLLASVAGTNFWEAGWLRHRIDEAHRMLGAETDSA